MTALKCRCGTVQVHVQRSRLPMVAWSWALIRDNRMIRSGFEADSVTALTRALTEAKRVNSR